jgi:hypothetical protein
LEPVAVPPLEEVADLLGKDDDISEGKKRRAPVVIQR